METQKFGTLESIAESVDNGTNSSIVPPLGVVFEEPLVQATGIGGTGARTEQELPTKGWDTMQRRGTHVFDSRDAEKLLTLKDGKPSSIHKTEGASETDLLQLFRRIGILDWSVLALSIIMLSVLFNECSMAFAYSDSLKSGIKALDDNDVSLATKMFTASILSAPESSDAHYFKAMCEISDNSTDEAIKDLDKSIDLDHKNSKAHLSRATLLIKKHRYHDAVKDCSSVLALNSSDIDALRIRAGAYLHEHLHAKAIQDASSFLNLYPARDEARADVLSKRAFAFDQQRNFSAAINDYSEAINCDPKNEKLFLGRAIARMHDKQWKNAISDCQASIALNSSVAAVYKVRARCYEMLNLRSAALADLDKLIELHSTVDTRKIRGNKRLLSNNLLGALEDFDYVLKADPSDTVTARKYQQAKEILQATVNGKNRRNFEAPVRNSVIATIDVGDKSEREVLDRGYELLMSGRSADAASYLLAAVRSNPNNVKARRFLAYAFLQSGRAKLAVEQFTAQESLESLRRTDKLAFASALAKSGANEEAISIYSNLITDNAKDDFARVAAIKILLKDGAREEARAMAVDGMQVSPEYRKLYKSLLN